MEQLDTHLSKKLIILYENGSRQTVRVTIVELKFADSLNHNICNNCGKSLRCCENHQNMTHRHMGVDSIENTCK